MFRELLDIIKEGLKKFFSSRFFIVGLVFTGLFAILIVKLFQMQVVKGEYYQSEVQLKTEKEVTTSGTRGKIYDRNGVLLAYNELTYHVTMTDTGAYSTGYEKNLMLIRLIEILDKHDVSIETSFPIAIDNNGDFSYTIDVDSSAYWQLYRDIYGVGTDELNKADDEGVIPYPTDRSAEDMFEYCKEYFGIGAYSKEKGDTYEIDDETALKLLNIRYALFLKSYSKSESITIATDVGETAYSEILENENELLDINVEQDYIRVYNPKYAEALAHILGYTGTPSTEQLVELKKTDKTYEETDIVGITGVEYSFEEYLSGRKGSYTEYRDSQGRVIEIDESSIVEAVAGNDVYLSIDADLTLGVYNLIEQRLAGILVQRITSYDEDYYNEDDANKKTYGCLTAYFQLINNNILSIKDMSSEDASDVEKQIYQTFATEQETVINNLSEQLLSDAPLAYESLDDTTKSYMDYVFDNNSYISLPEGVSEDETYQNWLNGSISLKEILYYAVSNNWITIDSEEKYTNADEIYQLLVDYIINDMRINTGFSKLIYEVLVRNKDITGNQLCMALFEQGVLEYNEDDYQKLASGDATTAYNFFIDKIKNLELTPAQLALDPCNASSTLTDPNTGEVLAVVTYPGYDINKLSGTIDATYYNSLLNDLSTPLFNNATQARSAPGSVFKLVTAAAGLEEGIIGKNDIINCSGVFTREGLNMKCWKSDGHDNITIQDAIQGSCNVFFAEIAYRYSLTSTNEYSASLGVSTMEDYAKKFGLGEKSGLEIEEYTPQISTSMPMPAAIGQGAHLFSTVHLSRYVTTIASSGTLYNYTLLNKVKDTDGNIIYEYSTADQVEEQLDFDRSTWDIIQTGMKLVISDGTAQTVFDGFNVEVAGKTGTAEEVKTRGPHATFIGYAPADDPEVTIAVMIRYGYTSTNSAELSKDILSFYFGNTTLEDILNSKAADITGDTNLQRDLDLVN